MSKINRNDIYDKNLNFLIGSGASFGVLPTLSLQVKDSAGKAHTVETLATHLKSNADLSTLLFSWYVRQVIAPAAVFSLSDLLSLGPEQRSVVENYQRFMRTILSLIRRHELSCRANIFTTNYDGLFSHVADKMIQERQENFILNDGGAGFIKRTLHTSNFTRFSRDQGVFDRQARNVPQINLIQMHGSVHWYRDGSDIEISYDQARSRARIDTVPSLQDADFDRLIASSANSEADLTDILCLNTEAENSAFWSAYERLPVVNPTKWKFHETVFDEYYYQTLRMLSYELEKPNSVFIVFGFSFADEHILSLVRRSLSNPTLKLYICCFSDATLTDLTQKFAGSPNVDLLRVDGNLDFTAFNEQILSIDSLGVGPV